MFGQKVFGEFPGFFVKVIEMEITFRKVSAWEAETFQKAPYASSTIFTKDFGNPPNASG